MDIQIVKDTISRSELKKIAENAFGNLVKAVVRIVIFLVQ